MLVIRTEDGMASVQLEGTLPVLMADLHTVVDATLNGIAKSQKVISESMLREMFIAGFVIK